MVSSWQEKTLFALARYHCLKEQQLRRIIGFKSKGHFNPMMQELEQQGYIIRQRRHSDSPYGHFLTTKGCQYLERYDVRVPIQRKAAKIGTFQDGPMEHTFAANDAMLQFELLTRIDPTWHT